MSDDAWQEIQAVKNKRNSLRERLEKRKIERQVILDETTDAVVCSKRDLHAARNKTRRRRRRCAIGNI